MKKLNIYLVYSIVLLITTPLGSQSKIDNNGFLIHGGFGAYYGVIGVAAEYNFYNINNSHFSILAGFGTAWLEAGPAGSFKWALGSNHRFTLSLSYGLVGAGSYCAETCQTESYYSVSLIPGYEYLSDSGELFIVGIGFFYDKEEMLWDIPIFPMINLGVGYKF
jgi:hypothetical protein